MSQMDTGRLVIADPSLMDERGHHYALTSAITVGALKAGMEVVWLANRELHFRLRLKGVTVYPIFSTSTYDPFKKKAEIIAPASAHLISRMPKFIQPMLRKLRSKLGTWSWVPHKVKDMIGDEKPGPEVQKGLVAEMLEGLDAARVTSHDHVLVHTCDGNTYRAMLEMVLSGALNHKSPAFHLNTPYDSEIMPHNRAGVSAARAAEFMKLVGALESRVFLYAENRLLAEHLSQEWGCDVKPLEIPPPREELPNVPQDDELLTVLYLGAAREEKGFHLLPDVVEHISKVGGAAKNIRFVIQSSPQIVGYTPAIKKAIEKLGAFSGELVSLIDTQQSMDDYFSTLQSADVVLLCYNRDNYRVRGSGIAVEAVCFGKIIIATPDTFPASVAGNAGLAAANPKEVAESILEVRANKGAYMSKALVRRDEYLIANSAEQYVSKMRSRQTTAKHAVSKKSDAKLTEKTATMQTIAKSAEGLDVSKILNRYLNGFDQGEGGVRLSRLIRTE